MDKIADAKGENASHRKAQMLALNDENKPAAVGLPVDEITQKLIEVVAREVEHLDSLLQLLTHQQRFLVEDNVTAVEENVQKQETAIQIARELEAERFHLLDRLAEHVDSDAQALTLSKLAGLLSGTYAARLKELQKTLLSITGNIQRTRWQNEMLINRSLFHIGETMRLLAGKSTTNPGYSPMRTMSNNAALVNRMG